MTKENVSDSYALRQSGIALAMVGDINKSIFALERAIELNPRDSVANAALGSILRQTGQMQESITFFRKAISLDPLNEGIYGELIQSEISLGNLVSAQKVLEQMSIIDVKSKLYLESLNLIQSLQSGR